MITAYSYPAVLSIAGSDSGGGAGIQADLKTISALGCYGCTAITAITVQNTLGVQAMQALHADLIASQITAVMADIRPLAVKIGMVPTAEAAAAIAGVLGDYPRVPIIYDPVLVSTSGYPLMNPETLDAIRQLLFPLITVLTPNVEEAALLASMQVQNSHDMHEAARKIATFGPWSVLVKGGHLTGPRLCDLYYQEARADEIWNESIETINTHGTGCTLSSAIAAYFALGEEPLTAVQKANKFVHQAILSGRDVKTGEGRGPLNHFFDPQRLKKIKLE